MVDVSEDAMGHLLHNIFAAPTEPGPPYTHTFSPLAPDPAEAVAWLREQIDGDLARARHILDKRGAHPDPRREMHDAIADCESKLAILDEAADVADQYGEESLHGRIALHFVDLLAGAYRHREGYARFWGDPVTHTLTKDGQ